MSVEWSGLTEFYDALQQLPEAMASEAADVVVEATNRAETQLREAYPEGETGKLRRGVKKTIERSRFGVVGTVRSTARHAHLWEYGTQHRQTRHGWNRGRSPSHAHEGLGAIASRVRRRMHAQLIEIVRRAGFDVSVSP